MTRTPRIYTRTGDDGTTGLASGERIGKDARRIEAYGTVDELNSQLGVVLATGIDRRLDAPLREIQSELFHLGAELASPQPGGSKATGPHIEDRHTARLEQLCDQLTEDLPRLRNFILPGGSAGASQLHLARTVCRKAERSLVALNRAEPVSAEALRYLNRLSDCLFLMARWENHARGVDEILWDSRR